MVPKLKKSNCDKTQKLKMRQNSICDQTKIVTTPIVKKLKLRQTQNVTTKIVREKSKTQMLQILDCDGSDSSDQTNFFPQFFCFVLLISFLQISFTKKNHKLKLKL
jgi:hypothetical protein